ncbi:MAG: hypothetical protein LIO46_06355 [Clostridiales bacterium]|nr:hypothetical protein [Clostridiales bacterium]
MSVATTALYKETVQNNARTWRLKIRIHPDSKLEPIELTQEDITLGSFVFEEASIASDTLDVGATYANSLQFAMENPNQKYSGISFAHAKVFAWAGLQLTDPKTGEERWEDIPLGEFFVQEDGKKMSTIPLQCFDRMVRLNAPVKQVRTVALSTGREIVEAIRMKYGFEIVQGTRDLINTLRTPLDYEAMADDLTCRDFIGFCAAYCGMNARFTRDGELEFFSHRTVPVAPVEPEEPEVQHRDLAAQDEYIVTTTPDTRMSGFTTSDRLIKIDGVTVKDAYGNALTFPMDNVDGGEDDGEKPAADSEGENEAENHDLSDDYIISVASNPLILTEDVLTDVAQRIYNMYAQTPYVTFSTEISGDPSIQAGDPVRHLAVNGTDEHVDSIITRHVYKFRGNGTIEAKGKSAEENRQLTATNKKIVESSMNSAKDFNDRLWTLDEMVQMQFSTITNALGFYTVCIRDEETGAIKEFIIQDTDPDSGIAPQNQWIFDGEKFVSVSDGKVTVGVSADGSIFAQRVLAEFLKTGLIESADGSVVIDLENGVMANRTEHGSTELTGDAILIRYMDGLNHRHVSGMRLVSGEKDAQGNYTVSIQFVDQEENAISSISQTFTYDEENRPIAEPLTTTDLRVQSNLEVVNAILYDKIQFQRKSGEEGNTGVDFVVMGE